MTEEQNTIALNKARAFSDNKDKIDGFYNGYVQATKELQEENAELKDHLSEEIELHSHAEDYIKSLEAQIEKMKCCNNCCNFEKDKDGLWYCKKGNFQCYCMGKGCKEWELAE